MSAARWWRWENSRPRTIYKEAVRRHPHDATCQSNFARLLLEECERLAAHQETTEALGFRNAAQAHFEEALRIAPDSKNAHEGLSHILRALGDEPRAEWHRRKAFSIAPLFTYPIVAQTHRFRCCNWSRRPEVTSGCKDFWTIASFNI